MPTACRTGKPGARWGNGAGEATSAEQPGGRNADVRTPAERAERAEPARAVLNAWNGYAPTPVEQDDLDAELDRRLAQAKAAR
ncbi:hypothetical protein OG937_01385 [Streptomyces sp. NBC_00510]